MLEITNTVLPSPEQWEFTVREMTGLQDSYRTVIEDPETHETAGCEFFIGERDLQSMKRMIAADSHGLRILPVLFSVNAPLYFWREFESFRFGASMFHEKPENAAKKSAFLDSDFAFDGMKPLAVDTVKQKLIPILHIYAAEATAQYIADGEAKEEAAARRDKHLQTLMHILPPCFMHRRNIMINYATLRSIYKATTQSKLKEWAVMREWIAGLPYAAELLTGEKDV